MAAPALKDLPKVAVDRSQITIGNLLPRKTEGHRNLREKCIAHGRR